MFPQQRLQCRQSSLLVLIPTKKRAPKTLLFMVLLQELGNPAFRCIVTEFIVNYILIITLTSIVISFMISFTASDSAASSSISFFLYSMISASNKVKFSNSTATAPAFAVPLEAFWRSSTKYSISHTIIYNNNYKVYFDVVLGKENDRFL